MSTTMILTAMAASVTVAGDTTCPTPDAVSAELDRKGATANANVELGGTGRGLRLTLRDVDGDVLAERELDGGGSCASMAEAAAVVVWAWTLRLPDASPLKTQDDVDGTEPGSSARDRNADLQTDHDMDAPPPRPPAAPTAGPATARDAPVSTDAEREEKSGPARHAVYAEVFGSGLLYTVNYEFRPLRQLALRAGLSAFSFCLFDSCSTVVQFVPGAYGVLFPGNHHLEFGVGLSLDVVGFDSDGNFLNPSVGYRYDREDSGFLFRVAFAPLIRLNDLAEAVPWGGISAGYTF